ncbi:MAG TPA: selenocysteine-specific translation elongation factor [Anaerolineales bacterium]|nr:selenocysteine-specific translation elongation factor [Anaerolineales bacterium]
MMRVIGTAGHVDHGKSTLVQALTGTHPDRLKEEREREMTIDLGFAFFTLPNGQEVGIVDVPGHRDFIENMLAGVGGIDAALFVVAADEGVMPQTREHLAILDLLKIEAGVIALTKTDMIDDAAWIDLIEEDVRAVLRGTVLEMAPIVRVSARTHAGVPALLEAITICLADRPPRPDLGRPRLPIDRVFTMPGFGTVVTGTLTDGHFEIGQEVVVQPDGVRGRIRGLQSHNQKEQTSQPGTRTAVNIAGVSVEEVRRGGWVAYPNHYKPTRRLDLQFQQLSDVSQPVTHNLEIKFFIGAAEVVGRLRLLGIDTLPPGETGWVQIELREPVIAMRGDQYILRRPSPGETLGGGMVVDPYPKRRHRRFDKDVLARLESLAKGTPEEVLLQTMLALGMAPARTVIERSSLGKEVGHVLDALLAEGILISLENHSPDMLITTPTYWQMLEERVQKELRKYHQQYPLRPGIPREELKSRLKLDTRLFNAAMTKLTREGELAANEKLLWHPNHSVQFSPSQAGDVSRLLARFAINPYSPPSVKEAQADVGVAVYNALIDLGKLVQVSPDVVYRKEDFDQLLAETCEIITHDGGVSVASFRDRFNTSRKYALGFLEYLDSVGVTVREGDVRRLRR